MKISTSNNQDASGNNVLIFLVSVLLGYNIYQEIYHPEKSDFLLCVVLLAFISVTAKKYGTKLIKKSEK